MNSHDFVKQYLQNYEIRFDLFKIEQTNKGASFVILDRFVDMHFNEALEAYTSIIRKETINTICKIQEDEISRIKEQSEKARKN